MTAKEATELARELLAAFRADTDHTGAHAKTCDRCELVRRAKKLLK